MTHFNSAGARRTEHLDIMRRSQGTQTGLTAAFPFRELASVYLSPVSWTKIVPNRSHRNGLQFVLPKTEHWPNIIPEPRKKASEMMWWALESISHSRTWQQTKTQHTVQILFYNKQATQRQPYSNLPKTCHHSRWLLLPQKHLSFNNKNKKYIFNLFSVYINGNNLNIYLHTNANNTFPISKLINEMEMRIA